MTGLAEFTLAAGDFPLGRLFETRPDARLDLDRLVPSGDTVMPYFWVESDAGDMAAVEAAFAGLPELRSITLMEDLGDRGLFRAEWNPEFMGIMAAVEATGVTVVSASGTRDGWLFELRSEDPEAFTAFQRYCDDHDIKVTLARLQRLTDAETTTDGLTAEQREALVLAYVEGYYDTPRRTDLDDLADRVGITRQAFAARLRRAYRNLVERHVLPERHPR